MRHIPRPNDPRLILHVVEYMSPTKTRHFRDFVSSVTRVTFTESDHYTVMVQNNVIYGAYTVLPGTKMHKSFFAHLFFVKGGSLYFNTNRTRKLCYREDERAMRAI